MDNNTRNVMNPNNATQARTATVLVTIGLVLGVVLATAPAAIGEGTRHPFFPTEPTGPGSGLYLTEDGMTTKAPKKGEPHALSVVTSTPLTSANTFTHMVTYKYMVTWGGYRAPSTAALSNYPVSTVHLSVAQGTAQLAVVGALFFEETPDFLFPDFCSQDYSAAASGEAPTVLRAGSFQAFTVTGCELPELVEGTNYQLRLFVSVDALGPVPPVLVIGYGSPATPSGVWLPGVADAEHATMSLRLYVESANQLSQAPPTDSTDERISCQGCNVLGAVDVPLGSYEFEKAAKLQGGAVLNLWMEFPQPEAAAYDNGLFLECAYWAGAIKVELRLDGVPVTGPSGHPGAVGIDLGEGPRYCLFGFGTSLENVGVEAGDVLSLVLLVRAPGIDDVREPTFFYGSKEKPTSLAFGIDPRGQL
ncbi:MAG: hypothetical protein HYT80_05750 [Euryarchaeota archaeon]|nr:hypothetical protein [Euryarchaeota archaeon]